MVWIVLHWLDRRLFKMARYISPISFIWSHEFTPHYSVFVGVHVFWKDGLVKVGLLLLWICALFHTCRLFYLRSISLLLWSIINFLISSNGFITIKTVRRGPLQFLDMRIILIRQLHHMFLKIPINLFIGNSFVVLGADATLGYVCAQTASLNINDIISVVLSPHFKFNFEF